MCSTIFQQTKQKHANLVEKQYSCFEKSFNITLTKLYRHSHKYCRWYLYLLNWFSIEWIGTYLCTGWSVCSGILKIHQNNIDIIYKSWRNTYFLKVMRVLLEIWSCHALFSFELFITAWPQFISMPCYGDIKKWY